MGLLHKLIANLEIGTITLSNFFLSYFHIKVSYRRDSPLSDNCLPTTCYRLTMHKEREEAKVVKGLLCFPVVETNPINTWHLPRTVNMVIP